VSSRWKPTAEHRTAAVERVISGLARGDDVFELSKAVADLHPLDNTFPGEVFISLAVEALDAAGADRNTPVVYEGLREKYLAECRFRGRDNRKIQFAVLAIGAMRGGIEPDLLDEVVWWQPTTSGGSPWRPPSPSSEAAPNAWASPCLPSSPAWRRVDRAACVNRSLAPKRYSALSPCVSYRHVCPVTARGRRPLVSPRFSSGRSRAARRLRADP